MKHITLFALLFSMKSYAQNADAIVGKWLKANKEDLIIDVQKVKGEYQGKITWSKDNSKPVGFLMLDKLKYNEMEKKWEGGEIHDPGSSRTYKASAIMQPDGTLEVTGRYLFIKSKRAFKKVRK